MSDLPSSSEQLAVSVTPSLEATLPPPKKTEGEAIKDDTKVIVFFKAAGDVPILKVKKFKFTAANSFASVVVFLRKQLQLKEADPLLCYLSDSFQPSPDDSLASLFRCFGTAGKDFLTVNYSKVPMWG